MGVLPWGSRAPALSGNGRADPAHPRSLSHGHQVTRDHLRRIRPRGSFVVVVVMSRPGVGPKGARRQNEHRLGALPVATQQLRKKIDRPNYGEVKRGP